MSLKNKRILVTRPQGQAHYLSELIIQQAGEAIAFPTLEIVAQEKNAEIVTTLENLNHYDWLIFISRNAVNFAVALNNGKIHSFAKIKIAAVGNATAQALKDVGLKADLMPEQGFNSEALLAMPAMQQVQQQQFLIVRGVGGRELLAQTLTQRAACVETLEVYQRQQPIFDNAPILSLLQQRKLSVLTAFSGESLQNLLQMLLEEKSLLLSLPLVVISDRIKQQAIKMGFKQVFVSASPADRSVLETIITVCNGEDSG